MSHAQLHDLGDSLRAVNRARSSLYLARTQGSLRVAVTTAQRGLLAALERYAAALNSHGHPMPYRMRSELDMYRAMFNLKRRHTR
jgi:hypothetical protein